MQSAAGERFARWAACNASRVLVLCWPGYSTCQDRAPAAGHSPPARSHCHCHTRASFCRPSWLMMPCQVAKMLLVCWSSSFPGGGTQHCTAHRKHCTVLQCPRLHLMHLRRLSPPPPLVWRRAPQAGVLRHMRRYVRHTTGAVDDRSAAAAVLCLQVFRRPS